MYNNVQQTYDIHPMLVECWASVADSGPTLTLLSLNLPLSSSSTTSREFFRNSRLVVDEDDLKWLKN